MMMKITGASGTAGAAQRGASMYSLRMQSRQKQQKGTTMNDLLGAGPKRAAGKPAAGKRTAGFSQAGMQAMLSAASSMKQAEAQGSIATELEGRAGVLEIEIKMDFGRGTSVEKKEEELAEVEQTAADVGAAQMSSLADVNEAVKEAASAEAEAAVEERRETKQEEKQVSNDSGKRTSGGNVRTAPGSDEAAGPAGVSNAGEASGPAGVSNAGKASGMTDGSNQMGGSGAAGDTAVFAVGAATAGAPLQGYHPVDIRL